MTSSGWTDKHKDSIHTLQHSVLANTGEKNKTLNPSYVASFI